MLYLAVDGGGTGCRAVVADASGRVLGRGAAGAANIVTDPDGARRNILLAAEQALAGSDARLDRLTAVLGLAGANVASAVMRLTQSLPFARIRVESDAVISVVGALGDDDGIVAALGTGSVYARQRAGKICRVGGWGLVLGDEASGAWLGRSLLSEVLRAVDGFRPMTPLLASTLDDYGDADTLVAWAATAGPAELARLAPGLVTADDPAARDILAEATGHVGAAIALLQDGQTLPVVFVGGLGPVFAERLGGRWPIRPPRGTALDWALQLALREG